MSANICYSELHANHLCSWQRQGALKHERFIREICICVLSENKGCVMVKGHSKLSLWVKWGRGPIEVLKETVEMWVSPTASYLSPPSTNKLTDAMLFFYLSNLCWSSKGSLLNLESSHLNNLKIKASNGHTNSFSKLKKKKLEFKAVKADLSDFEVSN